MHSKRPSIDGGKLPKRRKSHCWKEAKKENKPFFWKVNIKCNFGEKQRKEQNRQGEELSYFGKNAGINEWVTAVNITKVLELTE